MLVVVGSLQRHVHILEVVDDVQLPAARWRDSISSTSRLKLLVRSSFMAVSLAGSKAG
jgi:hypothetical protein